MGCEFSVYETGDHGLVLRVNDSDMADLLDDFFTEKCYIFYTTKIEVGFWEFYFGQLASEAKSKKLIERFNRECSF